MKKILTVSAILVIPFFCAAQAKNTIKLHFDSYHYANVLGYTKPQFRYNNGTVIPFTLPGISFSRSIYRSIFLQAQYSFWWGGGDGRGFIAEEALEDSTAVGKVMDRFKYHFFDIAVGYNFQISKPHSLQIYAGPSLAYGEDNYIVYTSISDRGHVLYSEIKPKMQSHVGLIGGLSYNYQIGKSGIILGADLRWRAISEMPFSYNYGLHIGYNF